MEQLLEILYSLDRRSRNVIIEALDPDVVDYIIYEEEAAAEEAKPSLRDRASALAQNVRGRLPDAGSYAGQAGIGAGVGAGLGAAGAAIHWAAKRRALSKKLKACTTDECKQQVKSQISALKKSALKRGLAATALGAAGGAGVGVAKKGVEQTDYYNKNIYPYLPSALVAGRDNKARHRLARMVRQNRARSVQADQAFDNAVSGATGVTTYGQNLRNTLRNDAIKRGK